MYNHKYIQTAVFPHPYPQCLSSTRRARTHCGLGTAWKGRSWLFCKAYESICQVAICVQSHQESRINFLSGCQVLVASDAMTRGMNVENVDTVINYDAPVYAKVTSVPARTKACDPRTYVRGSPTRSLHLLESHIV